MSHTLLNEFAQYWFKPVITALLSVCGWFLIMTYTQVTTSLARINEQFNQMDKRVALIEQSRAEGMAGYHRLETKLEEALVDISQLQVNVSNLQGVLSRNRIR